MWNYIRRYLHFAVLAGLFMVGEVLMDLIQPGIMSQIVDDGVLGLNNGSVGNLNLICFVSLFVRGMIRTSLLTFGSQMLLGQLNGTVEEMVSGYRTVVAYNHQDITAENFCATSDSLTKAGIKTDIFNGIMGPVMNCIGNIGFVIIAAFGGYFSINGVISVGVISAFI